jgi:hypothetical protein
LCESLASTVFRNLKKTDQKDETKQISNLTLR